LTGLHNRREFLNLAEQQLKIAKRPKIALLLLFADVLDSRLILLPCNVQRLTGETSVNAVIIGEYANIEMRCGV